MRAKSLRGSNRDQTETETEWQRQREKEREHVEIVYVKHLERIKAELTSYVAETSLFRKTKKNAIQIV